MILICYDGSREAEVAVKQAATLMPGHPAIILTVGKAPAPVGVFASTASASSADVRAQDTASRGAMLGQELGIDCQPRTRRQETTVAEAILAEARHLHVSAIVLGRRGSIKPFSGSVSRAVVEGAECAVLIAAPVAEPLRDRGLHEYAKALER